jgi:hypothetical protein
MGYDEDRSSIHTEIEEAAKESREKAEERNTELQKNRVPDVSDAAVVRGRSFGLTGSAMITDPDLPQRTTGEDDELTSVAVVPARHSDTGEAEVDKSKFGQSSGGGSTAKSSRRKASAESAESSS